MSRGSSGPAASSDEGRELDGLEGWLCHRDGVDGDGNHGDGDDGLEAQDRGCGSVNDDDMENNFLH